MDFRRWVVLIFNVVVAVVVLGLLSISHANMVFKVKHKFAGQPRNIAAFKAHDLFRHERLLSAVDLPLGGNGLPTQAGLYYGRIGLGNPSNDYYVHVDTGSDILWVNCAQCQKCTSKSDLGIKLTKYDPEKSSSAQTIYCGDDFCRKAFNREPGEPSGCSSSSPCLYGLVYGDGSSTSGLFIRDTVHLQQVTGNLQTTSTNGSIAFGCGLQQLGRLGESTGAVAGILGFGQAQSSMISQLAAAGKVKRTFAHCLDNVIGGGIFAIGEVVAPKVNTTPIVPDQTHYNVVIKEVVVGGKTLNIPSSVFQTGDKRGTIIDSGTTLAYLAEEVYSSMMAEIQATQPGINFHTTQDQLLCFQFNGNVDSGFPAVTIRFDGLLTLTVYPHDYLFIHEKEWCFGWQDSGKLSTDLKDMTILGDLVLSNRLVVYDIENLAIGITEYNCSSSIQVKDESSGSVYTVGAHNISSASRLIISGRTSATILLMLLFAMLLRNAWN